MDENAKQLKKQAATLFDKRAPLLSLWQEVALNFYPERADFTVTRNVGVEFADHLMSSYPLLARRDLGNSFSSMLRKDDWFSIEATEAKVDHSGRQWLENAKKVQRRAMYDRVACFERATKEGDHDYAAFGQCSITADLNRNSQALLFRNWHLRDLVWCESLTGSIDTVFQKWQPTARQLLRLFGDQVADQVKRIAQLEPYKTVNCMRVVMPYDDYESYAKSNPITTRRGIPYISIYYDVEHEKILQETPIRIMPFIIPRWQTVSGSQYAYSPATVCALPDARLIQAMTLVLLEAGEKSVDPPLLGIGEAIRGEVDLRAGGITWVDAEYDSKMQDVMRPVYTSQKNVPLGMEMALDVRQMISAAFFLNKLTLPPIENMTATEASIRVREYIRQALPLFEPMEKDYNAAICETTFDILLHEGAFGEVPPSLSNANIEFKFVSPMRTELDKAKATQFGQAMELVNLATPIDPSVAANVDFHEALRDALRGLGAPESWIMSEDEAEEKGKEIMKQVAAKQAAETAATAAPAMQQMQQPA